MLSTKSHTVESVRTARSRGSRAPPWLIALVAIVAVSGSSACWSRLGRCGAPAGIPMAN